MKNFSCLERALFLGAVVFGLSACMNVFDPIDNPSGDQQTLSAARAAFDKGDIATARELYGKIASNETARSEAIFLSLDGCGADIGAFASALSNGTSNPGQILTVLAEKMAPAHGDSCLATLLSAYQSSLTLTDPNVKGFTGFLASIAIAGEVLAHNTGVQDGTLKITDFVVPAACPACAGSACAVSDGISTAASVTLSSATSISPTFGTIQGAVNAATTALTLLNITSSPSTTLLQTVGASTSTNAIYRCALYVAGVGRT